MWVRKRTAAAEDDTKISAIVEPLPGFSDDEVVERLLALGASDVEALGPGFISVQAAPSILRRVESIAHVGIRREKQLLQNAR